MSGRFTGTADGEEAEPGGRASMDDAWWAMATLDADGRLVDLNTLFARLVGTTRDALLGELLLDHVPAESIAPELEAAARLRAGEDLIIRHQRRIDLPLGRTWEGEVLLSVVRTEGGAPQYLHVRLTETGRRRPPDRIAWREGDFPLALDEMRVGVAILGLDGVALQVNRALCELTGRTEEELRELDMLSLTHEDDREADIQLGTRAWMGELDSYTIEKRLVRPDGSEVWVQQEVTFARDDDGELLHLIGQVVDISDRKAVELELARSRAELASLVDRMPVGLLSSDAAGRIVTANPAAVAIAGMDAIPRGFEVATLIHRRDLGRIVAEMNTLLARRMDYHLEFRIVRPSGEVRWIRNDARPEFDEHGNLLGISGTWLDITQLKAAQDELRRHADHDSLTGLWNRRVVFDELTAAVARCEAAPDRRAVDVLFVDLDGFKVVNDDHGHGVGDEVLRQFAERLREAVGTGAVVGRLGGDEFVVCCEGELGDAHRSACESTAERIIAAVAAPFVVGALAPVLGASVGIAAWRPGFSADDLVNAADRSVYEAKRRGRNRWHRL